MHNEQVDVVVFLSGWVTEVVERRSRVHDVPVGKYCLHPHFMIQQQQMPGDPYTTPQRSLPSLDDTAGPRREIEMAWVNSRKQAVASDHRQQGEKDGGGEASYQSGSCLPRDPNGSSVGVAGANLQVPGSSQGGGQASMKFSPLMDTGAMWEPLYALMETLPEEGVFICRDIHVLL